MGTTAQKLTAIIDSKEDIKKAINEKGVLVDKDVTLAEYGNKIRSISNEAPSLENGFIIRFISPCELPNNTYVIKEVVVKPGESVRSFPDHPVFEYLTEDGWTHTLEQLSNVQHNIDVGAQYTTTDKKTHIFGETTIVSGYDVPLYFTITGDATFQIDWGDGFTENITSSQSYTMHSLVGSYHITFEYISGIGNLSLGRGASSTVFVGGSRPPYQQTLLGVYVGEKVTSIGAYAFNNCFSLTSVIIPEGVTSIGSSAFYSCYSLTSAVIPKSVTSIGTYAFTNCFSLTSVIIPEKVTSIGSSAFTNCFSLTSVIIPEKVTSIGSSAFNNCFSLTSVVIPEKVTSIGSSAFNNCYSLTSVIIPEGVTSIGDTAFYSCYSLTSVIIPEGVTSIGDTAFYSCYSLTSVIIPEGVTSIGDTAFYSCRTLLSYTVLNTVPPSILSNSLGKSVSIMKIFVPDASLEAYKTATNWVALSDYIYPVSQKPTE